MPTQYNFPGGSPRRRQTNASGTEPPRSPASNTNGVQTNGVQTNGTHAPNSTARAASTTPATTNGTSPHVNGAANNTPAQNMQGAAENDEQARIDFEAQLPQVRNVRLLAASRANLVREGDTAAARVVQLSGESIYGAAAFRREMEAAQADVEAAAEGDEE